MTVQLRNALEVISDPSCKEMNPALEYFFKNTIKYKSKPGMKNESFTTTIEVAKPALVVFNAIKEVRKWWYNEDFDGNSLKLNDEFIINHPGQHYSKQKLIEVVPNEKIVWLVTDSTLDWLQRDKHEWTNTKMIFEIIAKGDKTLLQFTHEGLVPSKECYAMCRQGWSMIISEWLFHFITVGTASAEMSKAAEIRNQLLENKA